METNDLIRRKDAIEAVTSAFTQDTLEGNLVTMIICKELEKIPSAKNNGRWEANPDTDAGAGFYICSVCGKDEYNATDHCPNCGASMREDRE